MSHQPRLELFRATWRPSLMWWLVLTVAIPFGLFVSSLLLAVSYGLWVSVTTGRPMPDLLGGLDRLPWGYIIPGMGALFGGYVMRGQGSGGAHNARPFEPSPTPGTQPEPSPTGGLVNNGALDQQ